MIKCKVQNEKQILRNVTPARAEGTSEADAAKLTCGQLNSQQRCELNCFAAKFLPAFHCGRGDPSPTIEEPTHP